MLIWTRLFTTNKPETIKSITQGSDGALYVTGETYGHLSVSDVPRRYPDKPELFASKLSSDGIPIWTKSFEPLSGFNIAVDSKDSVFIAAETLSETSVSLLKIESDGAFSWIQSLYSSYINVGDLIAGSDGSAYLATFSTGDVDGWENQGYHDSFVTKVSANGEILWTYAISGRYDDEVSFLYEGPDASIYVSGWTDGNLNGKANSADVNTFIIKINADGKEEWTTLIGGNDDVRGRFVTFDSEGSAYVISEPGMWSWNGDPLKLTKLSPVGRPLWTKELLGSSGSGNDVFLTAAPEEDEFFIVEANGDPEVRIQKFNLEGELLGSQDLTTTPGQYTTSVYADSSFVYLAGSLYEKVSDNDAFISKFSIDFEGASGSVSEGPGNTQDEVEKGSDSGTGNLGEESLSNGPEANEELPDYARPENFIPGYFDTISYWGRDGDETYTGSSGLDTVFANMPDDYVSVSKQGGVVTIRDTYANGGIDTYINIERIHLYNSGYAFDIDGATSAGGIYRLYKATFNREPDHVGLGYWISQADAGIKDAVQMAEDFTWSQEFQNLYGITTTDNYATGSNIRDLVTGFYENVLGRTPDQEGLDFYTGVIQTKEKTVGRVLAEISDSQENYDGTIELIANGINFNLWLN